MYLENQSARCQARKIGDEDGVEHIDIKGKGSGQDS
jgi:hypothetical protein